MDKKKLGKKSPTSARFLRPEDYAKMTPKARSELQKKLEGASPLMQIMR